MYISGRRNHHWAPHVTHIRKQNKSFVAKHFNGQNKTVTRFCGHVVVRVQGTRRWTQPRREEQSVKQEATGANRTEPTEEPKQNKQVEKQKDKITYV